MSYPEKQENHALPQAELLLPPSNEKEIPHLCETQEVIQPSVKSMRIEVESFLRRTGVLEKMQYGKIPRQYLTGIILHEMADIDEYKALYLLAVFGWVLYDGIEEIVTSWRIIADRSVAAQKTWREWEKEGWLLLGVGQGPNDEHLPERRWQSCADLVARSLGISTLREVSRILRLSNSEEVLVRFIKELERLEKIDPAKMNLLLERSDIRSFFSLRKTVKIANKNETDPRHIYDHVSFIMNQYLFHELRHGELLEVIQTTEEGQILLSSIGGEEVPLRYGIVRTKSRKDEVAYFAFAQRPHLDVILHVVEATNHIAIFFNQHPKTRKYYHEMVNVEKLEGFLYALCVEECRARQLMPPLREKVRFMMNHEECPWWYGDARGQILNFSSSTSQSSEATRLDITLILKVMEMTFSDNFFAFCDTKRCQVCPWNPYQLQRCNVKRNVAWGGQLTRKFKG